jgi:hypothetical protein
MDSILKPEPESEHVVLFSHPMYINDFTIYTTYKGVSYVSKCIKSIMIESSSVIKNALESDDSNVFNAINSVHPIAFRNILENLHTLPHIQQFSLDMSNEKIIQHMLMICEWFGMIRTNNIIINSYKKLLNQGYDEYVTPLYESSTIDLDYFVSDKEPIPNISRRSIKEILSDPVQRILTGDRILVCDNVVYSPVKSLLTGDKLNNFELIDYSLSLFKMAELEPKMLQFIKGNFTREKAKDKFYDEIYRQLRPMCPRKEKFKTRKNTSKKVQPLTESDCEGDSFYCNLCCHVTTTSEGHPICSQCYSSDTIIIDKKPIHIPKKAVKNEYSGSEEDEEDEEEAPRHRY